MSIDDRLRDGLARNAAHTTAAVEPVLDTVLRRRRSQVRRRVAGGVAGLATLAALTPVAYGELRSSPEPAPVAPSGALVGTYVVETSVQDVAGRWEVTVRTDGQLEILSPDGGPEELASYALLDGVLETNAFVNAPGCQLPEAYVGRYRWTRVGSTLRFEVVTDSCPTRQELFGAAWEEQP